MIVGTRITELPWVYRMLQGPHAELKLAPVLAHNDLGAARRVLDVGCGPGINTRHFAHAEYLGIDISRRYIEHARRRHGRGFLAGDATLYPYPEKHYDFILANSFFHHVDTPSARRTLAGLARATAEGGHVHILDLVLPDDGGPARVLAAWDRGFFVRPLAEWRELFSEHFEELLFEPYGLPLFGVTCWHMVYFKGRPR